MLQEINKTNDPLFLPSPCLCVCVCRPTGEHEAEEVAGSSQHDPVCWKVFPLNHQGHVTEGALQGR